MLLGASDAQLLELAAKAHGRVRFDPYRGVFRHVLDMGFLGEDWRPFEDDDDALRLAALVGLFTTASGLAEFQMYYSDEIPKYRRPTAATRRAIVTLAAVSAVANTNPSGATNDRH